MSSCAKTCVASGVPSDVNTRRTNCLSPSIYSRTEAMAAVRYARRSESRRAVAECFFILGILTSSGQPDTGSLEASCVDASISLQDDGQGLLHCTDLLRRALHFNEDVLLVSASTRGARAANDGAPSRKHMGFA